MTIIKHISSRRFIAVLKCIVALSIAGSLLSACGSSHSGSKAGTPNPTVEGPVAGAPVMLASTTFDLATVGYEQSEYFISGSARSFINTRPMQSDGKWSVRTDDTANYKTRILVYRPIDPAAFNGTVIVEWLNVSAGTDSTPIWMMTHTELIRKGYAWVGITAQQAAIDGTGVNISGLQLNLKAWDPVRYASLVHPGDKYAFDIFSQGAQAVLHPSGVDPLGGLHVERAIGVGQSQSADFLVTYVNAIAPISKLFDGYFINSRFHGTVGLDPNIVYGEFAARSTAYIRDDLDVPVMVLETETDLVPTALYHLDRQEDSTNFRLWEMAGTAHADLYVSVKSATDIGGDPNIAAVVENASPNPILSCPKPVNDGPAHFIVTAAMAGLENWIRNGVAPPHADRLEFDEQSQTYATDSVGNVLGGVRTPYVDAPIAVLSGIPQPGSILCNLFGTTQLLDSTQLASLYPDHATFVSQVNASVDNAVREGFLLQVDGDLIKVWAQSTTIGNP